MKVVRTRNEIVTDNYQWALDCLTEHELDIETYHGDICIFLCELADKLGDVSDCIIHQRIHNQVHYIQKSLTFNRNAVREFPCEEIITVQTEKPFITVECLDAIERCFNKRCFKSRSLPERTQKILRLHYCDNFTYAEIGEMFNISGSCVQEIIRYALRTLRHPDRIECLEGLLDYFN